ncbi:MAG: hypothetical protein J2P49_01190 [Methylocapsa sp.]|nr:hypothetical protein [Methylocapsa sp.]
MLATANERPIEPYLLVKILRACELWNNGDKALAYTHLAHANLPPCGEDEALQLFAARVPAGNGRESGQWTSGGAGIGEGVVEGRSAATGGADDPTDVASNEKDKSYEERRVRGEESPKEDVEHGRGVPLVPEGPLAPPPPSQGAQESARPQPKPSDFVGQDFGKLGTAVEKPDVVVTEITGHANERMTEYGQSFHDLSSTVSDVAIRAEKTGRSFSAMIYLASAILNSR